MSVPEPFTTLTLTAGATVHQVDIYAALSLSHSLEPLGGYEVLRAINGRAILQRSWQRRLVEFSGEGSCPPGFEVLDLPAEFTLSCPTLTGSPIDVIVMPPSEQTDAHGAVIGWSLTCEEV